MKNSWNCNVEIILYLMNILLYASELKKHYVHFFHFLIYLVFVHLKMPNRKWFLLTFFFHEITGQCWIEFWAYPHASCQWQFGGQQCWGHATQNLFANDVNKWRLRPPPHRNKLSKTGVDLRRSFTASGKKKLDNLFFSWIFILGPSLNDLTHLGGGGSVKRWYYSMGDKGS